MRLRQLLQQLRPAAPEAPAEQQDQKDPGGSWHRGGPERIHSQELEESLPPGPLPWLVSRVSSSCWVRGGDSPTGLGPAAGGGGWGEKRTLPTLPLRTPSPHGGPGSGP